MVDDVGQLSDNEVDAFQSGLLESTELRFDDCLESQIGRKKTRSEEEEEDYKAIWSTEQRTRGPAREWLQWVAKTTADTLT